MARIETSQPAGSFSLRESGIDWELEQHIAAYELAAANAPGELPDLADFAPDPQHPRHAAVLIELIRVEMELSAGRGRPIKAMEYRDRFPQVLSDSSYYQLLVFEQQRISGAAKLPYLVPDEDIRSVRTPVSTPPDRLPEPGEMVGDFEVLGQLAEGAFSRVYCALDTGLSRRHVVLKVSAQFPGEVQVLSRLQHKNIVPIYSVHRHGKYHVVCMPFLGATTLADFTRTLEKTGKAPQSGAELVGTIDAHASRTWRGSATRQEGEPVEPTDHLAPRAGFDGRSPAVLDRLRCMSYVEAVLWIVSELADGLEHAHQRGILHRDIKPANVLLTDDGMPMLLDFNLALSNSAANCGGSSTQRNADSSRDAQDVVGGTMRYMSPEHLRAMLGQANAIDARSDVYSLGLVLSELLNHSLPAPPGAGVTNSAMQSLLEFRENMPAQVVDAARGISPCVAAIVRKALAPDPARRYQTAAQFHEDLQRQLEHRPLKYAENASLRERLNKWNHRHPRLSATTLVASLALVVVATLSAYFAVQQSHMALLRAEQWSAQLAGQQTVARSMLASSPVFATQLRDILSGSGELIQSDKISEHLAVLEEPQRASATAALGRLLFYRARGSLMLASLAGNAEESRVLLGQALSECRNAVEVDPASGDAAGFLAESIERALNQGAVKDEIAELMVDNRRDQASLQGALELARASLHAEASNPRFWLSIGQLELDLQHYDEAASSLRVAHQLDPQSPWPPLLLGTLLLDQREFSRAEQLLSTAIGLRSDVPEAYLNRALARIGLEMWSDARDDLNQIENEAHLKVRVLFARETVHRRLGRMSEADADFAEGLQCTPADAVGWNVLGEAKLRQKPPDWSGALADFDRAAKLAPDLRNTYQNMAHVLSECLGRTDQAIEALDAAIQHDASYALAWSPRAVLHARQQHRERAVSDAEHALTLERSPLVCYQAASALALVRVDASDDPRILGLLKEVARSSPQLASLMAKDPDLVSLAENVELSQIISAAAVLQ